MEEGNICVYIYHHHHSGRLEHQRTASNLMRDRGGEREGGREGGRGRASVRRVSRVRRNLPRNLPRNHSQSVNEIKSNHDIYNERNSSHHITSHHGNRIPTSTSPIVIGGFCFLFFFEFLKAFFFPVNPPHQSHVSLYYCTDGRVRVGEIRGGREEGLVWSWLSPLSCWI